MSILGKKIGNIHIREEANGADDPQLGKHLNTLAQVKLARGDADAAESLYRRALDATRRWLEEDPEENLARAVLATSHRGLGEVADHRGDAVARPLLDAGWARPRSAALAREHGLLPSSL